MKLYKCIKEFPGGPKKGSILKRGNYAYSFHTAKGVKKLISLQQKEIEENPEYFQEVTWLIHSFKNVNGVNTGNIYTLNIDDFPDQVYCREKTTRMTLETCEKQRYRIWSILRVSDGAVFKVGKYVQYNSIAKSDAHLIDDFKVIEGTPFVHYAGDVSHSWYDDFISANPVERVNFTREDVIHAFTYGLDLGKKGIPNGQALEQFKESQNL